MPLVIQRAEDRLAADHALDEHGIRDDGRAPTFVFISWGFTDPEEVLCLRPGCASEGDRRMIAEHLPMYRQMCLGSPDT